MDIFRYSGGAALGITSRRGCRIFRLGAEAQRFLAFAEVEVGLGLVQKMVGNMFPFTKPGVFLASKSQPRQKQPTFGIWPSVEKGS